MGGRINTVLQTCFFSLAGILPADEAIQAIKESIAKTYGKRGQAVLDSATSQPWTPPSRRSHEVEVPAEATSTKRLRPAVPDEVPDFVERVTSMIIDGKGDLLPVSAMPVDGTFPTATAQYEKRSIAMEIPIWDPEICIDCARCALVCPHAAIRMKYYDPSDAGRRPPTASCRRSRRGKDFPGKLFTIQVAPDDCTGCGVCVNVCPAKSKEEVKHKAINMVPQGRPPGAGAGQLRRSSSTSPRSTGPSVNVAEPQGLAVAAAAVRVLGCLRRLRRDAVREAGFAVVRGPDDRRQRHGMLVDLRRQPADHAVGGRRRRPGADLVQLACSRTTPSSVSACASPSTSAIRPPLEALADVADLIGDELLSGVVNADQTRKRAIAEQRARVDEIREIARPRTARRDPAGRCRCSTR